MVTVDRLAQSHQEGNEMGKPVLTRFIAQLPQLTQ